MAMSFNKTAEGEWKLNVCGYTCPHPQMYTKKALQKLESGDVLILEFDNPSSGESILAMCEAEGNDLLEKADVGGAYSWKIRKA